MVKQQVILLMEEKLDNHLLQVLTQCMVEILMVLFLHYHQLLNYHSKMLKMVFQIHSQLSLVH